MSYPLITHFVVLVLILSLVVLVLLLSQGRHTLVLLFLEGRLSSVPLTGVYLPSPLIGVLLLPHG